MVRGTFRWLLVVAAGITFFYFSQHVARLTDCRNYARNGDLISDYNFLKNACPNPGPYGDQSNVFVYALLSPFVHSGSPAADLDAAGKWQVRTIGGPIPVCQLTQSGNDVTGICDGPSAIGTVKGSVSGQTISWSWDWTLKKNSLLHGTWNFNGTKNAGGDIVGSTAMNGHSLEFVAQPVSD